MRNHLNRSWHLVSRPDGRFAEQNFEMIEAAIPEPEPGEVLVRVLYLSLDPTYRIWAREKDTYMPSIAEGAVMRGITLGQIVESKNERFAAGDLVMALLGWEDYSISDGSAMIPIIGHPPEVPLAARFALYEHIGASAYFGLTAIGRLRAGETVVVSAAAGAVGSLAVQMAKNLGARVVGFAGTAEKCSWVRDELGADAMINYRTDNLSESLARACPEGIDVYFDNTGGEILEAVLDHININARIAMCGAISSYDDDCVKPGPGNLFNLLFKRASMEGFVSIDYAADPAAWTKCNEEITRWHLEGKLKYRLDLEQGLDVAPKAILKLFTGENNGKLVVQLADEKTLGAV